MVSQKQRQLEDSIRGIWKIDNKDKKAAFQGVLDYSSILQEALDFPSHHGQIHLATSIAIGPNFIRSLSKEEQERCKIEGPLKREDIDTILRMGYHGIDEDNELTATFREGSFVYGVREARGFNITRTPFQIIRDIRTLENLKDPKINPAYHILDAYILELIFEKIEGLPKEFKKSIGEFYKDCILRHKKTT